MKNFGIMILTRGRAERQITLANLPKLLLKNTYLVVDGDELKKHKKKYKNKVAKIVSFPKGYGNFLIDGSGNFSDKKQWTSEWCRENGIQYMVICDDDLKFDARKKGKLKPAEKSDVIKAFNLLYIWMSKDKFAHVAMSPREGNNWEENSFQEVGRAMRICGFDLEVIKKHNLKFNRTILMADFDITLQLLELGYPNRITYTYANGQRKSNDDGGCSLYRTPERMTEAAESLHKLHPNFVRVQIKTTSKPWCGFKTNKRTDVTITWKKAYEYGLNKKKKGITSLLKKK